MNQPPNNTLEVTFDLSLTVAVATADAASNAPQRGRWAALSAQRLDRVLRVVSTLV